MTLGTCVSWIHFAFCFFYVFSASIFFFYFFLIFFLFLSLHRLLTVPIRLPEFKSLKCCTYINIDYNFPELRNYIIPSYFTFSFTSFVIRVIFCSHFLFQRKLAKEWKKYKKKTQPFCLTFHCSYFLFISTMQSKQFQYIYFTTQHTTEK